MRRANRCECTVKQSVEFHVPFFIPYLDAGDPELPGREKTFPVGVSQRGLLVHIPVESGRPPRLPAISERHGLSVIVVTSMDTITGEQVTRSVSPALEVGYEISFTRPVNVDHYIIQTYRRGTLRLSRFISAFENSSDSFQHRCTGQQGIDEYVVLSTLR